MIYTWHQRLSAFNVHPFLIDYIKLKLLAKCGFFAGKYDDRRLRKVKWIWHVLFLNINSDLVHLKLTVTLLFKHNHIINLILVWSWLFHKTWLASAIWFYGNFHTRHEELNTKFWNVELCLNKMQIKEIML